MSSNFTLTSLDFFPALGALALRQQFPKRKNNSDSVFNFAFLSLLITFPLLSCSLAPRF